MTWGGSVFDEPTPAEVLSKKKPSRLRNTWDRIKTAVMCPFNKDDNK